MTTPTLRRRATVALVACVLTACGGLDVARMLPPTVPAPEPRFQGVVRVMPVTGARPTHFGGPALVSNEMFRDALVAALAKSKLFGRVESEARGDWELHADFVAHGQGVGLDYRAAMVVQYRIVQARSAAEVWRQSINSRHEVTVSQALSGATRTTRANEGAVRENLAQLIGMLSTATLVP